MAWREARAAPRRLLLLTGAVAIGVGALVAIDSFTDNLQASVRAQAQTLLGADLSLTSRQPLSPRAEALVDTLACLPAPPCGAKARVTSFSAMAYVPRTSGTRLVQVAAIEGAYPFYGEIRTAPATAWSRLQQGQQAMILVEPSLLTALSARLGDTLALGEARFTIAGSVLTMPADVGIRSAFGPKVYLPARHLDETKLLGFGARAEYEVLIKLRPSAQPERIADAYRPALRTERVRIRTVADDRENLNDALSRLASYLALVGVVALLLGGLGVASATTVLVRQKLDTIAVLRCLGATSNQIVATYAVQTAGMGLAGGALGVALGVAVQQLLPGILAGLLPVDVIIDPSPSAMAAGLGIGLTVAVLFALPPLVGARLISPLAALRRPYDGMPPPRDALRLPIAAVIGLCVVALAARQVGSWRTSLFFSGGVAVALALLWLAALGLVRAVRRWFPTSWPYVWRQGLANLYRPANQTLTVVLALGFGAFLLGTLLLVQHNLLRRLRVTGGPNRPNVVLFDIQPDQRSGVDSALRASALPIVGPVPIVPMRIASVKGRPTAEILSDTSRAGADGFSGWAFRREYRSTYRDTIVASERIVAGEWVGRPSRPPLAGETPALPNASNPPVPISVETGVAGELGVGLGDEIVWDVQGVPLASRVTSLREVDWARFEPNFFFVFQPGPLDEAPQTFVTLTRIPDAPARGRFQRRLVERFSNVTSLDLSTVQATLERLIARVTLAIRFMALFSLATGALVLIGALATSRFQRIRESVLLRTLGATRRQVLRIVLAEYAALGLLASVTGAALACVAAWALSRYVFDAEFSLPLLSLAGLVALVAAGTVAVGLANSRDVLRRTPLESLRVE